MKDFTEIDSIYRETISKLDLKERINYCENLIDDLQDKLLKRKRISKEVHKELYEILLAAQAELITLREAGKTVRGEYFS